MPKAAFSGDSLQQRLVVQDKRALWQIFNDLGGSVSGPPKFMVTESADGSVKVWTSSDAEDINPLKLGSLPKGIY